MSSLYSAAGDSGLVDGVRGSIDRRGGHWQGYRADDITVEIDLGEGAAVEAVKLGFLQHPGSGVYHPRRVEVAASEDGESFGRAVVREVAGASGAARRDTEPPTCGRLYVEVPVAATWARALRIRIETLGRVPRNWPSAGETAWTYIDECIVR